MVVIDSLKRTPGAIERNPVLAAPVAAYLLLQFPQLLSGTVDPALQSALSMGWSLVTIVVAPFYLCGLFTMADEALDGTTSLASFVEGGKRHYVQYLIAYVVLMAINLGVGVVLSIVGVVAAVVVFSGGGLAGTGPLALAALGLVVGVVALAYLAVNFLLQFYGQAVVIDDEDGIDALKRSVSLVRGGPASALGFALLHGAISLVGTLPVVVLTFSLTPGVSEVVPIPALSNASLVALGVGGYALSIAVSTFTSTYAVSFYRAFSG
jgi:hypothetical protein